MATLIGFGNLAERDPPAGSFDFPQPPSHAPGASFSLAPWLQDDSFRGCPHYKCDEVDHDVHNLLLSSGTEKSPNLRKVRLILTPILS